MFAVIYLVLPLFGLVFPGCLSGKLARLLMAIDEKGEHHRIALVGQILKKIFTHPFILATNVFVIAQQYAVWLAGQIRTLDLDSCRNV